MSLLSPVDGAFIGQRNLEILGPSSSSSRDLRMKRELSAILTKLTATGGHHFAGQRVLAITAGRAVCARRSQILQAL